MKRILCTCGGLGFLPKAPGTWGSLPPLLIVLVCGHFGLIQGWIIALLLALLVVSSIVTIKLAPWYSRYFGKTDPPQVFSDEVAGQSIALLGMAWLEPNNHVSIPIWIGLAILSFALFRLFDIWKPWIIDKSQQLPAGWGVIMDDILAGFFAGLLVLPASILLG